MQCLLKDLVYYSNNKINYNDLNNRNYISTENMLPNFGGITNSTSIPKEGKSILFQEGDILLSNIRPYFKKLYYANFNGGCSNDVLCFRVYDNKIINSKYLYYALSTNKFIDYVVSTSKGTKMPRGDKKAIMKYELNIHDREKQDYIVDIIGSIDDKIENNNKIIDNNYKMLNLEMKKYIKNEFISIGESKHISLIKSGIDKFDRNKIYLDTSSVNGYSITDESYIITYDERPSRANMQPIINSIWFAKLKNSPKYIIVKDYSADLINNKIFSTGFCGLKIDKDFLNLFSTYITSEKFNKNKDQLCIGATMQGINNSDINNIKIPNFSKNDCENFNIISEPIYKYIYNLTQENKKLLELKDLYLKKFFS